jgi:hypothetical protein
MEINNILVSSIYKKLVTDKNSKDPVCLEMIDVHKTVLNTEMTSTTN